MHRRPCLLLSHVRRRVTPSFSFIPHRPLPLLLHGNFVMDLWNKCMTLWIRSAVGTVSGIYPSDTRTRGDIQLFLRQGWDQCYAEFPHTIRCCVMGLRIKFAWIPMFKMRKVGSQIDEERRQKFARSFVWVCLFNKMCAIRSSYNAFGPLWIGCNGRKIQVLSLTII